MKFSEISVVIPCFNEGKTVYQNILKIYQYIITLPFIAIAIFGNVKNKIRTSESADNTLSELRFVRQKAPIRIINNLENREKGNAVRKGVSECEMEN